MPLLPAELNVDPVLAGLVHCVAFLELSHDDAVDPDWAVEAMEHVSAYLGRLEATQVESLSKQLKGIAKYVKSEGAPAEVVEFFRDFLENFGVGDSEED
jgi:hypothetical protein